MARAAALLISIGGLVLVLGCARSGPSATEPAPMQQFAEQTSGSNPSSSRSPPSGVAPSLRSSALYYFTTSPAGARSVLWQADSDVPLSSTGTLQRRRITQVEHAAGYSPRGAVSSGGQLAWLRLPPDRGHASAAELWLGGERVAERALYLQTPVFWDEDLYFLRRSPGPERFGPDGRLIQSLDDFELLRLSDEGRTEQLIHSEASLWLHFVGLMRGPEPRLLLQRVSDAGSQLLEFDRSGKRVATHFLGPGAVRDVRVDPGRTGWVTYLETTEPTASSRVIALDLGAERPRPQALLEGLPSFSAPLPSRSGDLLLAEGSPQAGTYRVPLWETPAGAVLWREHESNSLSYTLAAPDGQRARLVPPGDAAQDVSLLRGSP